MKMKVYEVRRILSSLSDVKVKEKGYKKCPRCSGSGNYSYNSLHGTTCYKCNGLGYVKINIK